MLWERKGQSDNRGETDEKEITKALSFNRKCKKKIKTALKKHQSHTNN